MATITASVFAAPLAVSPQPLAKVSRIGILTVVSVASSPTLFEAFRQGLREHGYVEGQNLAQIARSITASLELNTVLQRIAEGSKVLCRSDGAAIFLRESDDEAMVARYRVGPWLAADDTVRITPGQGLGGHAMVTGRPLRTEHDLAAPRLPDDFHPPAEQAGAGAVMVVPVVIQKRVEGLLYVSNRSSRLFTDDDEMVCVRLAEQAAIAIQNARHFSRQDAARAEAEAANRAKDERWPPRADTSRATRSSRRARPDPAGCAGARHDQRSGFGRGDQARTGPRRAGDPSPPIPVCA